MTDLLPRDAYQMLYDYLYRVARWPDDLDVQPLNTSLHAISIAVDRIEILERDLKELSLTLESERKARGKDIETIDNLQMKLKEARP